MSEPPVNEPPVNEPPADKSSVNEPPAASPVDRARPPSRRDVVIAGHAGDRRTVEAAAGHPEPAVRAARLGALHRLGLLTEADLDVGLTDPDVEVRRRAAELAADLPAVELLGALADADPTVVEMAAFACGEREQVSDPVLDRLVELTTDADEPLVREAAAAALGAIGDRRGLPAILAACADKPAVRRRAVLALAPFLTIDRDEENAGIGDDRDDELELTVDPVVDAAIEAALVDRDWQVRQAAEDLRRATAD